MGDLEMVDGSWGDVRGGEITREKLDGAEGMRGVWVSWINKGENGTEGVRGVVGFIGDEDWLTGIITIFSMS